MGAIAKNKLKLVVFLLILLQFLYAKKVIYGENKYEDLKILQGEWNLVEIQSDIVNKKGDQINGFTLYINKNNFIYKKNGIAIEPAIIFHIDPSRMPKLIVLEVVDGVAKGAKREGIYELDKNLFKFNMSLKGRSIPMTIEPKKGEGQSLAIYKKRN